MAIDGEVRQSAQGNGPLLLTVSEAAGLLRISRNLAYELIAQNRLPHIRLGRRILVPRHGLVEWIGRESALPQSSSPVVSFSPQR